MKANIVVNDGEGRTRWINGPEAVMWFFYTLKGEFPKLPKMATPTPEQIAAREEADAERKRSKEMTVTMPDGTKARLTPLSIPR